MYDEAILVDVVFSNGIHGQAEDAHTASPLCQCLTSSSMAILLALAISNCSIAIRCWRSDSRTSFLMKMCMLQLLYVCMYVDTSTVCMHESTHTDVFMYGMYVVCI